MRWVLVMVGIVGVISACGEDEPIDLADLGRWERLPDPPLRPRNEANVVGVGDQIVVFGGTDFTCPPNADCDVAGSTVFTDGAAYDRTAGQWRPIADSPVPTLLADTAVVGDTLFALPRDFAPAQRDIVAYNTASDDWARIPPPSGNEDFGSYSIVAMDGVVVVYSTTDERGASPDWILDTAQTSWTQLPDDPLGPGFDRVMTWNGASLFLFDKALVPSPGGADGPSFTRAASYVDGAWRTLPTADTIGPGPTLVDDERLITPALGCADGGDTNGYGRCIAFGSVFNTDTSAWEELPNAPGRGRKDLSSFGGYSTTDLVAGGVSGPFFDAATNEWFDLPPLDTPTTMSTSADDDTFETRRAASVGDAIVVVGGDQYGPDGNRLLSDAYMWSP